MYKFLLLALDTIIIYDIHATDKPYAVSKTQIYNNLLLTLYIVVVTKIVVLIFL